MLKCETPENIVIKLKKLIKKIENMWSVFDDIGITPSQARIIFPVVKDGRGYSIRELSRLLDVDKALVSRTVADLESKGFVEREKTADNVIKNHKIVLSGKGQAFYETHKVRAKEFAAKCFNGVSKDELIIFKNVLDKLTGGADV